MLLETKANQVCAILNEKHNVSAKVAFDLVTIATVIAIIYHLVKLFIICGFSPAQAIDSAMNPGILGQLRMRFIIKGELRKRGLDTNLYHPIKKALLESANDYTPAEMQDLYMACSTEGTHEL